MEQVSRLAQLNEHLARAAGESSRASTFDMDDQPDLSVITKFFVLHESLGWVQEQVIVKWREADTAALKHQKVHRRLARTAIVAGTLAIVCAIAQLALRQSWPTLTTVFIWLELAAAIAAAVAVGVGWKAKFDRQWLSQRHRAEGLRMLKFRALGRAELWNGNVEDWKKWLGGQLKEMEAAADFDRIKEWATRGNPDVPEVPVALSPNQAELGEAFAIYYRHKRLAFQASYFHRQSEKHRHQVGPLRRYSLQWFIAGLVCVFLHLMADLLAARFASIQEDQVASILDIAAVWAVALAAILPVLGLGARSWTLALEHSRSASLFAAKHRALSDETGRLEADAGDLGKTLRHIAHVENFLEEEHREWLRLLLEAEWFL